MLVYQVLVFHVDRELGINVFVVEKLRPPKDHAEVHIQGVSAPKCTATAFHFYVAYFKARFEFSTPIKSCC